jgi:uncharacterized protein (TIGR02145 family)
MKKQLSFFVQMRLIVSLLFSLWGLSLSAQVSVSNMATTYTAKQVSFTVSWTSAPYNDQIWVIVDYIKMSDASTAGNWSRATVTAVTKNAGTGTAATVTGQRGFWLNTSGSSGSANVTATLILASGTDKFNWCAYGLNYPPNATIKAGGGYDLHGTKPFRITYNTGSSTITDATTFDAGCITAITDATDNPAGFFPALPTITIASGGSNSQTVTSGSAITPIKYTTANASGVSANNLPAGVSGSWTSNTYTISGTPTPTGTFIYTVITANINGCMNSTASGTITQTGTPEGAGTNTWTCGTQTWSGALSKAQSGCISSTNFGTTAPPTSAMYRSSGLYSGSGYLYNWKCVNDYGTSLCPAPWRVPTRNDFVNLDKCFGGSGNNRSGVALSWISTNYIKKWGFVWSGWVDGVNIRYAGIAGYYWSATEYNASYAYYLGILNDGQVNPQQLSFAKHGGYQVRCVK